MSTRNKNEPSVDGSREVWGASLASLPPQPRACLHPLGPPERPLDRSAAPSHATALSPAPTPLPGPAFLRPPHRRGPLPLHESSSVSGGPGECPVAPAWDDEALIVPWPVRGSVGGAPCTVIDYSTMDCYRYVSVVAAARGGADRCAMRAYSAHGTWSLWVLRYFVATYEP